jgi:hypothetical protein
MSLDELEEKARLLTRNALRDWQVPTEFRTDLTLGSGIEGDDAIFELYVAGERPQDAIVLTRARVNRYTGEGTIQVFEDRLTRRTG